MSTLKSAICLAASIHDGQVKSGEPYILHPLRVMLAQQDDRGRIVGVLHDVIEKSDLTLDHLVAEGFSSEIVMAVEAMTRRKGEEYFELVKRAASNPISLPVKVADLRENLRAALNAGDVERQDKYRRALELLGYSE